MFKVLQLRRKKEPSPFTKIDTFHNRRIVLSNLKTWRSNGYKAKVTTITCKEGEGYVLWVDLNKRGMIT